jgi:AcrR family transcriptional regulator
VSLDDILEAAAVTKGAMYFHFRSKYALALALINEQADVSRAAANSVLGRRLSGLETLVDLSYLVASQDLSEELARAGFNLIEGIGRADGVQAKMLSPWIDAYCGFVRRAISEGDVRDDVDPDVAGRLLVALYMGLRQTSDLSDARMFIGDLERMWLVLLQGMAHPDRIGYITQFITRRTAMAVNTVPLRPVTR